MFRRIVSGIAAGRRDLRGPSASSDGCVTRPVAATNPITKTNFITSIPHGERSTRSTSSSTSTTRRRWATSRPIWRRPSPTCSRAWCTPNCVDATGKPSPGQATPRRARAPTRLSTAEFPPVHDMHIGIVSSSLGPRLGDACHHGRRHAGDSRRESISRHNDDQAHLLNRAADPNEPHELHRGSRWATRRSPDNFLDWFPPSSVNRRTRGVTPTGPAPVTDPTVDLQQRLPAARRRRAPVRVRHRVAARDLVPLPHPARSVRVAHDRRQSGDSQVAQWVGVDTTILAQRADFLRPDSLVAVIVLDRRERLRGRRALVRRHGLELHGRHGFNPPRGTSICATNPATRAARRARSERTAATRSA